MRACYLLTKADRQQTRDMEKEMENDRNGDSDKYFYATAGKVGIVPFTFMIVSCVLLFIDLPDFDCDP